MPPYSKVGFILWKVTEWYYFNPLNILDAFSVEMRVFLRKINKYIILCFPCVHILFFYSCSIDFPSSLILDCCWFGRRLRPPFSQLPDSLAHLIPGAFIRNSSTRHHQNACYVTIKDFATIRVVTFEFSF